MFLIGDSLHRRFRSQNMKSPADSASVSSKKDEWALLFDFLSTELRLRECLALDRKASQAMGISKPGNNDSGGKNIT